MALPIKIFTPEELRGYFRDERTNYFYKQCKQKYEDFLPHSDGAEPTAIIEKQRPNEPDHVKEFRLSIWKPITKPTFSRVVSSLSKIRRSSDWNIIYPKDDFARITEGFELEQYCEKQFPYFASITNWVFNVLLKQYLIDPNGVIFVMPLVTEVDKTDYLEPFPYLYNCYDVIDFKEQEYAILRIAEGCTYIVKNKVQVGKSFYVVTAAVIERHDQIDDKGNFAVVYSYAHNLNFLPVFKNGGVICKSDQNSYLYESRISGILPNLDEAIAEYTDLQAGKRLNIYPERWEYSQHECKTCNGTGRVPNLNWKQGDSIDSVHLTCSKCNNGYIPTGPYSKMLLRPAESGMQALPTPPAGFIEKDIEIIRLMSESVDAHIYKALAAINFQFLEQTPLNQSGTAKEVDKEELNNTVHLIAEDIVALMDKIYKAIAYYRYMILYTQQEINLMLPTIPVPEHFDLISSQYMQDEIKRSRDAKMNPLLISEMEVEYSSKRFSQDDEINKVMKLVHHLDPLPGFTIDEKIAMAANKTITRNDNIISDNIVTFVRRALFEDNTFDHLAFDKQLEQLNAYADEIIAEMDEAAKMAQATIDEANAADVNNQDAPVDESILA